MTDRKRKKPRKLSKTGKILTDVILVVSLCVAGYSGYKLYEGLSTYNESKNVYDQIRDTAVKKPITVETAESSHEEEEEAEDVIDHAALSNINSDYVGWIKMKNSYIDYPMVESIRYTKFLPDANYLTYTISRTDCNRFKGLSAEFSAYRSFDFILLTEN